MGKILIENIEIYAYHGLVEEERKLGRKFTVNVSFTTDFWRAAEKDEIEGTINYQEVCELVQQEMAIPSKLLENVGHRIIKALKNKFESIVEIELKISKHHPPIPGKVEKVSVVLNG